MQLLKQNAFSLGSHNILYCHVMETCTIIKNFHQNTFTVSLTACCMFQGGLGFAALAASSETMFPNWVVDAIQQAFLKAGWLTRAGMPAHYLWSISSVIRV